MHTIPKKIICLCYVPVNQQLEKTHYIREAIQDGFTVEYWDLSEIFFPGVEFAGIEKDYVRKVGSYRELEGMIRAQELTRCFFVITVTFYAMAIRLHRLLTKYHCYTTIFARSSLPEWSLRESPWTRIIRICRSRQIIKGMKEKCLYGAGCAWKAIRLIKNYDLVFAAGSADASKYNSLSRIVRLNHVDYDDYLGLNDGSHRIADDPYCVFLDDNLAYDTDYRALNLKTVEPSSYFQSLRSFFDFLEKDHAVKVVIAAHPKAAYRGGEFGDRLIFKGRTNELTKHCRYTIAHYSTSISFPVLYKKPVLFIYTDEMKDMFCFKHIQNYASALGGPMYNIDQFLREPGTRKIAVGTVDPFKYDDYKYKYLTSPDSENELSCDVFLRTMRSL